MEAEEAPKESQAGSSAIKAQVETPGGVAPKESPSRAKRLLRTLLLWIALLAVAFGAGWLVSWQNSVRPLADRLTKAEADLSSAQERIANLEEQLQVLTEVQNENEALQAELENRQLHVLLLRVQADVNATRLALEASPGSPDTASARLYLSLTSGRLDQIGALLGAEHKPVIADMQARLKSILSGMTSEEAAAATNLALLANNLLQIENIYFAGP